MATMVSMAWRSIDAATSRRHSAPLKLACLPPRKPATSSGPWRVRPSGSRNSGVPRASLPTTRNGRTPLRRPTCRCQGAMKSNRWYGDATAPLISRPRHTGSAAAISSMMSTRATGPIAATDPVAATGPIAATDPVANRTTDAIASAPFAVRMKAFIRVIPRPVGDACSAIFRRERRKQFSTHA